MKSEIQGKCGRSAEMLEYMYGEMAERDRPIFETHLESCEMCVEEFAHLSEARYSVYEWRKLDFAPLETPRFVIPAHEASPDVFGMVVGKIRTAFSASPSWAIPAAGFALVMAVFGVGLFTSLSRGGGELAVKDPVGTANRIPERATGSASPDVARTTGETSVIEEKDTEIELPDVSDQRSRPVRIAVTGPERNAQRGVKSAPHTQPARAVKVRTQTASVPRLNEFSDDEDTSIRLADMFDDVESLD
ncbi:MAG: hypothetical protein ABI539_09940 [Acidobacteriota bacterium]